MSGWSTLNWKRMLFVGEHVVDIVKLHRDAQFKCVNHDFGRGAAFERVERIPYSYADERHSQETIGDLQ